MTNVKIRNRPADDAASQQNVTAWPTEAVVAHRQTVRAAQKTDVALLTAARVDGNGASPDAPPEARVGAHPDRQR